MNDLVTTTTSTTISTAGKILSNPVAAVACIVIGLEVAWVLTKAIDSEYNCEFYGFKLYKASPSSLE